MRDTSVEAYHRLNIEGISDRHKKIIDAIDKIGSSTDREIAKFLDFDDPNKVRPRRKELLDAKIIVEEGKRICQVSGRTSYVWGFERGNKPKFKEQGSEFCIKCGYPTHYKTKLCKSCEGLQEFKRQKEEKNDKNISSRRDKIISIDDL